MNIHESLGGKFNQSQIKWTSHKSLLFKTFSFIRERIESLFFEKLNDFWFQNHFWWDFFRCCFWSCQFYSIEMIIWQLKNLERSSIGYKSYFRTKNCICLQNVMPVLCNSLRLLISLPCTVVQSPPYTTGCLIVKVNGTEE